MGRDRGVELPCHPPPPHPPTPLPRELEEVGMKPRPAPRKSAPVTMGHLGEGNGRCTALGAVTEETPKNKGARSQRAWRPLKEFGFDFKCDERPLVRGVAR